MKIRVLLFSVLRERIGAGQLEVEVPNDAQVRDLVTALAERFPVVKAYGSSARVALNQEYAELDDPLSPTDEVALITPVSGG